MTSILEAGPALRFKPRPAPQRIERVGKAVSVQPSVPKDTRWQRAKRVTAVAATPFVITGAGVGAVEAAKHIPAPVTAAYIQSAQLVGAAADFAATVGQEWIDQDAHPMLGKRVDPQGSIKHITLSDAKDRNGENIPYVLRSKHHTGRDTELSPADLEKRGIDPTTPLIAVDVYGHTYNSGDPKNTVRIGDDIYGIWKAILQPSQTGNTVVDGQRYRPVAFVANTFVSPAQPPLGAKV